MAGAGMAGAGRTGHGVRAGSVTLSPQGLLAGSTMRLSEEGAALFAVGHARGGRQRPSLPCGLRATSNAHAPGRRYELRERRTDYGCPKCGQALHRLARSRASAGAACPLRSGRRLPRLAVARPCHADGLRRRAPLRQALPVHSRRARPLDPRRAVLLPRSPRPARSITGLAPELDDRRLHRREDPQRGRDVRRSLPHVLACAAHRPAVLRLAHRRRGRRHAGDGLPRIPHVRGARVSGLPADRRRAREGARGTAHAGWRSRYPRSASSQSRHESSS